MPMVLAHFDAVFAKTAYPSGESHLRMQGLLPSNDQAWLRADIRDFNGLCDVIVADRLRRRRDHSVRWFIPFFPFARDDRRNDWRDGSELELALDLVRREGLDVTIVDPHSDVAGQLRHISQLSVVGHYRSTGVLGADHLVVIPDMGASKKAHTWIGRNDHIQCLKKRDTATGKLSGFQVLEPEKIEGRDCIIVDDICDAGGTFIGLAKLLRQHNPKSLTLAVSHGLFTKGREPLEAAFDRVVAASDDYDALFHYPST